MNKPLILCFAAHADDLEYSCTGLLSRLIPEGYEAVYVVATAGENGFKSDGVPVDDRIRIRQEEQRAAARAIGVEEVVFLGHRDGFLTYTEELRAEIVGLIRKYEPELILSFDPANRTFENLNLFHRDHRVLAEAVFDACFAAKNRFMYPGKPHRVKKLYLFGTDRPDHFEDITEFIDRKLEILALHASQFADFSIVEDYIRNVHSKRTDEYRHCEAYRVVEVKRVV
jgi:LmbE family N-acetylglucosaminyl deacetylase